MHTLGKKDGNARAAGRHELPREGGGSTVRFDAFVVGCSWVQLNAYWESSRMYACSVETKKKGCGEKLRPHVRLHNPRNFDAFIDISTARCFSNLFIVFFFGRSLLVKSIRFRDI